MLDYEPWFFSDRMFREAGRNISINDGILLTILAAQRVAFFLMYVLDDFINRSTSPARS